MKLILLTAAIYMALVFSPTCSIPLPASSSDADAAPTICCSPDQFEAGLSFFYVGKMAPYSSGYGQISYDFKNLLLAISQTFFTNNGTSVSQRTLLNGKTHKFYAVDSITKKCQVMTGAQLQRQCVPSQFKYTATITYGDTSGQMTGNVFEMNGGGGNISLMVTKKLCTPIFATSRNGNNMATSSLFNVTMGIKDPSVFNIPPGCKETDASSIVMRQRRSLQTGSCPLVGLCGL